MTSVAIATLVDEDNFGNRLQNWALQEALLRMGCDMVETIVSVPGAHNGYEPVTRAYHLIRGQGRAVVRAGLQRLASGPPAIEAHVSPLAEFSRSRVRFGARYSSPAAHGVLPDGYDHVIVGSDQVWNPVFGLPLGLDFLEFAREEQRIAYAGSFGVDSIPRRLRTRYRSGLAGIPHLSVREVQGQRIVRQLSGRDAVRVVDPTLLHDDSFWLSFARERELPPRPAFAAVALLAASGSRKAEASIERLEEEGLGVVDLLAREGEGRHGKSSPQEFLNLISAAECVLTDSFHVASFALLFGKPLELLGRPGMNSRLATLLDIVGLTDSEFLKDGTGRIDRFDSAQVLERIAAARGRSLDYLVRSLD